MSGRHLKKGVLGLLEIHFYLISIFSVFVVRTFTRGLVCSRV